MSRTINDNGLGIAPAIIAAATAIFGAAKKGNANEANKQLTELNSATQEVQQLRNQIAINEEAKKKKQMQLNLIGGGVMFLSIVGGVVYYSINRGNNQ